ncbi:hypothetical protein KHC28_00840 [Ancylobacter sonchi]|uniref:hypothetical protein n=1 Tax=Ancylobacter sonchi TaxID=1937790 RepID=UPI001BD51E96|nr:hypothetical protein [Ancylobacter sonchi]MBS7532210.1 hypothetical protein [Ancylobacter sonchi]
MPDIYTDLADATDPAKGAGLVGLGAGVAYPSGTVGGAINDSGISHQVILPSIAGVGSLSVPDDAIELVLQSRADGEGGFRAKEIANSGALLAGQFLTNINARRWENAEDTITPAMFADIAEMFAFTKAQIQMPAKFYEFNSPITTRVGAVIRAEDGAKFVPTFSQASQDRGLGLLTLSSGTECNLVDIYLAAGINQVTIGLNIKSGVRVGRARLVSADYNNNLPVGGDDADRRWAAVTLEGTSPFVQSIETDFFRVGAKMYDCTNPIIGSLISKRCLVGFNPNLVYGGALHYADIDGVAYEDQTRTLNENGLITGANGMLLSGVQDFHVGYFRGRGALEHEIRIGYGLDIRNNRIHFGQLVLLAPHGCGFKADDADHHTTTDIHIDSVYVEDAGRDLPFPEYQGWGNKDAIAIRNVERFSIGKAVVRSRNYTYSGGYALWIEKSSRGSVGWCEVHNAFNDGVRITPNGENMLDVTVQGVTSNNGRYGVSFSPVDNTSTANRVTIKVDSYNNTAGNYDVADRPNGTDGLVGPLYMEGFSRQTSGVAKTIGPVMRASTNFFDEMRDRDMRQPLVGSKTYNQPSIPAKSMGDPTTITVTGAVAGAPNRVEVSGTGYASGITWSGTVSADDTVTVYAVNPTTSALDPASGTITAFVTPL